MTRQLTTVLATLLFLPWGCATPTPAPVVDEPKAYSSVDLHTSFRVPLGWAAAGSWSPPHAAPHAARFESPAHDAAVTLAYGPIGELSCAAAARAALLSVTGSVLRGVKAFDLQAASGKIPAGHGETSGPTSQGVAKYFCAGQTAVVVEAAATKSSFATRLGELEGILDSVAFDDQGQQVAVRAPGELPPTRAYFVHRVRFRGETLARIARWYTGTYDSWREIALANEGLTSPNTQLKIGREVKIPSELVVHETPFPEPRRSAPQVKQAPAEAPSHEATETQEQQEETAPLPPVIGPR
jgi:LysM domain